MIVKSLLLKVMQDELEHIKERENEPDVSACDFAYTEGFENAIQLVKGIGTVTCPDECKHGHWARNENGSYFCSACGNEAYWDSDYGQQMFKFCPECGVKMDGEANE